jgi:hypothetical protein
MKYSRGEKKLSHCHFIHHNYLADWPAVNIVLHLPHVPEDLAASFCISYWRNFKASICITCLHLHHLPEELASIGITYRRNVPPSASSAGRPLNASICITYGRNLLHLHNVSEELTTSICITYWRNLNALICTTYYSARTRLMLLQTLPQFTVPYSPCLQAIFVCLNCPM